MANTKTNNNAARDAGRWGQWTVEEKHGRAIIVFGDKGNTFSTALEMKSALQSIAAEHNRQVEDLEARRPHAALVNLANAMGAWLNAGGDLLHMSALAPGHVAANDEVTFADLVRAAYAVAVEPTVAAPALKIPLTGEAFCRFYLATQPTEPDAIFFMMGAGEQPKYHDIADACVELLKRYPHDVYGTKPQKRLRDLYEWASVNIQKGGK